MLEAKVYLYLEPYIGVTNKIRYITDISEEKKFAGKEDFFNILKQTYHFKVASVRQNEKNTLILSLIK